MKHSYIQIFAAIALTLSTIGDASAASNVAQSPLLNSTAAVRPNIALVLDTSGSMDWDCVYAKHVTDVFISESANLSGLTSGCLSSSDTRHASPINNYLFYNPNITYARSYSATGALLGSAPIGTSTVVTLYRPKAGQDPTTYTTSAQLTNTANYDKIEVRTTGFRLNSGSTTSTNHFGAHGGSRKDDCAGTTCTLAEERQNIANWRLYNLDRMSAAKTGLGGAFASQPDNFRLAYGTIYGSPNVMTDFGIAKPAFYSWLAARTPAGATPLRAGLKRAGDYYSSSSNSGPWGSKPWSPPSGETAASHLSCRRSFTLMITDGYYNDGLSGVEVNPTVGNVDANTGNVYTHATALPIQSYKYTPKNTSDPRNRGKSDIASGAGTGTSNTLADIAMKYWVTDLRTDLANDYGAGGPSDPAFWQNMNTYMVSFGASGTMSESNVTSAKLGLLNWATPVADKPTTIDDMRHAAHNGGGDFLKVNNAAQFATDLGNVIGSIAGQQFSQAGVAASAVTLTAGTKKFVPYFISGSWWGNLKMVNVATQANLWEVIATDANGQPTGASTFPLPVNRNIVVWADATKQAVAFNFATINNAANNLKGTNANMQLSSAVTTDIVDFLRGDRTKEGTTFRKRQAILGDIVNSSPAFIKNNTNPQYDLLPAGTPGQSSFGSYLATKALRNEGALFVGANDGMLHAFAEGYGAGIPGRELFAYIPRSVLGKVESLSGTGYAFTHTFTVDGPMTEADAYVSTPNLTAAGSTVEWKNLLVGTTGAGAKAVFALNVSDLTNLNGKAILWEINADPAFPTMPGNLSTTFAELGHVFAPVQSGITKSGDWVSVFGNGYESTSGKASLFIVETATGKLLKRIDTDAVTGNGLGGVRLVLNANKQIIGAYAGDLKGRLWKFDLSGTSSSSWGLGNGGVPLFTAMSGAIPLPITAQPAVLERTDQSAYLPSYLVTVATGKLFEIGDAAVPSANQAVYGLWDRKAFGSTGSDSISDSSLEPITQTLQTPANGLQYVVPSYLNAGVTSIDWSTKRGWKNVFNLSARPGQRVIDAVEQILQVVKIDTVTPDASATSCKASTSNGLNLIVDPLTGVCRVGGTLDTNRDGAIDENDTQDICGYTTLADGRDVILVILNNQNQDTGLRNAQSSSGGTDFRAGGGSKPPDCTNAAYAAAHVSECTTPSPDCFNSTAYATAHKDVCCKIPSWVTANPLIQCNAGGTLTRSWRQLFPRIN
jgi:type IV pilus assembly protein PilY1